MLKVALYYLLRPWVIIRRQRIQLVRMESEKGMWIRIREETIQASRDITHEIQRVRQRNQLLRNTVSFLRAKLDAIPDRAQAEERAIELWRASKDGRDFQRPGYVDLCVWLMQALEDEREETRVLLEKLEAANRNRAAMNEEARAKPIKIKPRSRWTRKSFVPDWLARIKNMHLSRSV